MNAAWWMLVALAVLAIGYRYYSAFLAAKVLCLDDTRRAPAHVHDDGHRRGAVGRHPGLCQEHRRVQGVVAARALAVRGF